jgi:hypothetical protein
VSSGEAADPSGGAYRQFNVRVHFGEAEVAGFAEASGLDDAAPAMDGSESLSVLILNRGVCGRAFLSWLCSGGPSREVSVTMLDEMHRPIMRWTFAAARPCQFTPPASLADPDAAPLETVRLEYRAVASDEWRATPN